LVSQAGFISTTRYGKGETKMISISNHDATVLTYISRHPNMADSERKELVSKLQSPAKEIADRLGIAQKLAYKERRK